MIWQFQRLLSRRLLTWNLLNLAVGLRLSAAAPMWRGVGTQAVGWGLINVAIALFGGWSARRRLARPDAFAPTTLAREARNLRRLLWLNAGLDVLYMLGGRWLMRRSPVEKAFQRGNGLGIILQGGLLLVFDVVHALLIKPGSGGER